MKYVYVLISKAGNIAGVYSFEADAHAMCKTLNDELGEEWMRVSAEPLLGRAVG